jgi:predicted metal-dependent hydrolase
MSTEAIVEPLTYQLIRSRKRKKTLTLQIRADGMVVIHSPYHTPDAEINRFFRAKETWVRKKLAERKRLDGEDFRPKSFVAGERFCYLGESYPLEIRTLPGSRSLLSLSKGVFHLSGDHKDRAREVFVRWYRRQAKEDLSARVEHWSRELGLRPRGIRITGARYRFGSCSPKNSLSFSWRLIMAPLQIIDYIVVHELAHIKEKSHSGRFWLYVERILPDYKTRKRWLKERAHFLDLQEG